MPATSFTLVRRFEWPPRPAPAKPRAVPSADLVKVRAPAPRRPKKKPKLTKAAAEARRAFRPAHLTLLADRIEAAIGSGLIDLADDWGLDGVAITAGELVQLLAILLPEAYADRPDPAGPLGSAPGSPDRVAGYAARRAAGAGLYHPADATFDARTARTKQRANGSGLQVLGWGDAVERVWALAEAAARRDAG